MISENLEEFYQLNIYKAPLVEGKSFKRLSSRLTAILIAPAQPLKIASIL